MLKFSQSLQDFQFECIGDAETDDEINIGRLCPQNIKIELQHILYAFYSTFYIMCSVVVFSE